MQHRPPKGSLAPRTCTPCPPETLALGRRADALARGDVVVVGNRAGVVEWTNDAWTRLTGFPLEQTLDKPITHFLDHAGLEVDLVEFVAQHFLDGRRITVELPFATLDGREIHVHLEVEPIREPILPPEQGTPGVTEISRFIAVVREVEAPQPDAVVREVEAPQPDTSAIAHPTAAPARANTAPGSASVDVASALSAAVERKLRNRPGDRVIETLGVGDLPSVQVDSNRLAACLDHALDSVSEHNPFGTTFVTSDCGWLEPGRSHCSLMHPIAARAIPPADERRIYIEIHDTLPHLDREAIARARTGRPGSAPREGSIARAAELAASLGFSFHLDSTAGSGTQLLMLVPADRIANRHVPGQNLDRARDISPATPWAKNQGAD